MWKKLARLHACDASTVVIVSFPDPQMPRIQQMCYIAVCFQNSERTLSAATLLRVTSCKARIPSLPHTVHVRIQVHVHCIQMYILATLYIRSLPTSCGRSYCQPKRYGESGAGARGLPVCAGGMRRVECHHDIYATCTLSHTHPHPQPHTRTQKLEQLFRFCACAGAHISCEKS